VTLNDRLREVRRDRQLTLLQVAGATKLSVSYLSDLERGRTTPSLETLNRLASCYTLSTVDLLAGVEDYGTGSPAGLAPGLADLLKDSRIDQRAAEDLNRIELRGKRPQTAEEWYELYLHLHRIIKPYLSGKDSVEESRQ